MLLSLRNTRVNGRQIMDPLVEMIRPQKSPQVVTNYLLNLFQTKITEECILRFLDLKQFSVLLRKASLKSIQTLSNFVSSMDRYFRVFIWYVLNFTTYSKTTCLLNHLKVAITNKFLKTILIY